MQINPKVNPTSRERGEGWNRELTFESSVNVGGRLFYLSLLFELIFGAPRHLEPPRLYNFRTWVIYLRISQNKPIKAENNLPATFTDELVVVESGMIRTLAAES